jgi:hypothetical protein
MTGRTLPLRLEEDLIQRIDALAEALTERAAGAAVSRTAAMRAALQVGLNSLEAELGIGARPKPKPKRK